MSDFWGRKVRTFFKKLASDGKVTQKSYEHLGGIFSELGKWHGAKEKQVQLFMIQVWNDFFEKDAVNGAVDEKMFVDLVIKQRCKVLPRAAVFFYGFLFDAIDLKGAGVIHKEDFNRFAKALHIDESFAEESFKAMAQKGGGKLSREEFVSAGVEYWCTDDETYPSKLMLGPLVD